MPELQDTKQRLLGLESGVASICCVRANLFALQQSFVTLCPRDGLQLPIPTASLVVLCVCDFCNLVLFGESIFQFTEFTASKVKHLEGLAGVRIREDKYLKSPIKRNSRTSFYVNPCLICLTELLG